VFRLGLKLVAEVVFERVRAIFVGYQALDAGGAFFDWSETLLGDVEAFAGVEDLLGGLPPFARLRPGGVAGIGAGAERGRSAGSTWWVMR